MGTSSWTHLACSGFLTFFFQLALAANAPVAYVASSTCLQMYNATGPVKTVGLPTSMYPMSVAVSPDNKFVYVADMYYGADVQIFDATTLARVGSIPGTSLTSQIAFLPDGSAAYLTSWTGSDPGVKIVDPTTNTVVKDMTDVGGTPYGLVASPDSSYVYVAGGWGFIFVINTRTRTIEATIQFNPPGYFYPYSGYPSWGLGITPDGQRLYVPNQDGVVYVVDTKSRTIVAQSYDGRRGLV